MNFLLRHRVCWRSIGAVLHQKNRVNRLSDFVMVTAPQTSPNYCYLNIYDIAF